MPFQLGNLKIRHQILLLALPSLFGLLTAVGLLSYAYWEVTYSSVSLEQTQANIAHSEALLQHVTEMRSAMLGYLLTGQPASLNDYHMAAETVRRDLAALPPDSAGPSSVEALEELRAKIGKWRQQELELLKFAWQKNSRQAVTAESAKESRQFLGIQEGLRRLIAQDRRAAESRIRGREMVMRRALKLGATVALILALLLVVLLPYATRSITRPVRQLIEASEPGEPRGLSSSLARCCRQ